ncbi:MAG TPA: hypothetical protein VM143_17630 [Acidimicrobiales bacterium]|nr:hypothetical protein [Acidimicrobiales bacterium]
MEPITAPPAPEKTPFLKGKRLSSAIIAGGAALAMTLAGLGIANAQTDDTTPPSTSTPAPADGEGDGARHHRCHGHGPRIEAVAKALGLTVAELKTELTPGKSIADVAAAHGVDLQKVIDSLVADAKVHLAEEVAAGDLTQAEADARAAKLPERITELVNHARPLDGPGDGDHKGGPGRPGDGVRKGGPGRPGDGRRDGAKPNLEAAASVLGLSPDELRTELEAGKSLATIAGEHNVAVGKVVEALVADANARLEQAVTDGRLTQAQADERTAHLTERITDLVNHAGRPRDRGHHEGPDGGHHDAPDDARDDGAARAVLEA